ncbi:MAG: PEP-CTERM sorting domain-containing protein [Verrucomicrobia bacterium]|nr:PEP-CTERM sorting domain-containing protein [Verrucomicrobiota bacterium]
MNKPMKNQTLVRVALAACLFLLPQISSAQDFMNVDFDHSNNLTQSGYFNYFAGNQADTTQIVNGVGVRLYAPGNFDTRDRGTPGNFAGHPQSDLLRDFVFRNGGFNFQLGTASNPLPAGNYILRGYHHDTAGTPVSSGSYRVSDAVATEDLRAMPRSSSTFNTSTGTPMTQVVQIQSDGINPVLVNMQETSGNRALSGFDLLAVTPNELRVDFGAAAQRRQQDYFAFDALDNNASSIGRTQNYLAAFGANNDAVQVTIGGANRAINRGNSTDHVLGDLVDSWVGTDGENTTLTLSGLNAGSYQMTTFHHEHRDSAGFISGTFDILVDGVLKESGVSISTGILASGDPISSATFSFLADGTNDVVVTLDQQSGWTMVNGMVLIPEPSTLMLVGLFGIAGLLHVRRKRG